MRVDEVRREGAGTGRRRKAAVFAAVALAWLALDMASKAYFNAPQGPGDTPGEPILGIFRFNLVHNTGAAWGMFGDSTLLLGVTSSLVCVGLVVYLFVFARSANTPMVAALALVFAGGIGNAIDRFTLGYVVDFIEPVFIDFPVFNVADIGVTCGFVIFIAALLFDWREADKKTVPPGHPPVPDPPDPPGSPAGEPATPGNAGFPGGPPAPGAAPAPPGAAARHSPTKDAPGNGTHTEL